ncbi:hypothetical protein D3C83_170150 [compost metagenome]
MQKRLDLIEARVVTDAPLTPAQEAALRERVLSQLPPGLQLQVARVERIERGASGKFEEFLSEVSAAPR